ncbi:hypothetical protein FEM48_Zijuj03G0044100 [Ziziphus jujuba var. spinosa]|uniref:DUF4219 domain-containing protein n=1 Tax=Ziziphus jujuba var. spinosa TaxID=714518 RepID=A0A978VN61_ZIZJJ|nr:hypothetical protein FEM48_Zijuj03G0044100 [Ziziphus jujuba var. spinosa]
MSTNMGVIPIPSSGIVPQVLKNNLENYKEWSIRLRTYLMTQDVWDVMEATPTFVDVGDVAVEMAWKRKNATALHAICIACGPRAFSAIQYIPEAKGIRIDSTFPIKSGIRKVTQLVVFNQ